MTEKNDWDDYKKSVTKLNRESDHVYFIPPIELKVRRSAKAPIDHARQPLDARVDLHGLNESQAYERLENVFRHCIKKGFTKILVVTGKGYDKAFAEHSDKGIIRREFVKWMTYSTLSPLIRDFSVAKPHDGGDGAFYVNLKKINSGSIKQGLKNK